MGAEYKLSHLRAPQPVENSGDYFSLATFFSTKIHTFCSEDLDFKTHTGTISDFDAANGRLNFVPSLHFDVLSSRDNRARSAPA